MKRFVDLRGAETGSNFAFYCTVTDRFQNIGGEQAWDTVEEFQQQAALYEVGADRFVALIPEWVPKR